MQLRPVRVALDEVVLDAGSGLGAVADREHDGRRMMASLSPGRPGFPPISTEKSISVLDQFRQGFMRLCLRTIQILRN